MEKKRKKVVRKRKEERTESKGSIQEKKEKIKRKRELKEFKSIKIPLTGIGLLDIHDLLIKL
ncbi:hypothetical protein RhiirA1_473563 [Rhizophagus irregularis]|uniref:Uncharacterized protein n=1 Tax=Rhizophagus irregularis TaxID=588596 RepID=A0A2I1F065_9GLOM|nr:hypothetical protein RhiirA1_473563 [Rhizophagus irregularis]PKY27766.1 hypothetical protein RhiirB3_443613 [Rhizophagus irregularis]